MNIRDGCEVTLEKVLDRREARAARIQELHQVYPEETILSLKINIPGPIKNNACVQFIFDQALASLPRVRVVSQEIYREFPTGPEALIVFHDEARRIKALLIDVEEQHPLGRLFDLDIFQVNRRQLGHKPRKCLLCVENAVDCQRTRKHTADELLDHIDSLVNKVSREANRG